MSNEAARRLKQIIARLKKHYPEVQCALMHRSAFELLAATILSAQCTDVQVNKVTPELFRRFGTAKKMAAAPIADLERLIHSTGFFRNKARNLKAMSKRLETLYHGQVPSQMDELLTLPGVARKTANVVLGDWFAQPAGMVVDTHVKRITTLLGFTTANQPEKIEQDLIQLVPQKEWVGLSHRFILLGRQCCVARRPRCAHCPINDLCPSAMVLG